MTLIQVLGGGFILLGMGIVIATPYQVKSTYSVSVPMGFWVLRQDFQIFGIKWSKEWHVNMAMAQWVDSKTGKPVTASKETWLNGLVHKWIVSTAETNGEEVSHV